VAEPCKPAPRWAHPDLLATDLVDRRFTREGVDQLWVTDITEHPTREGKLYCCVVLDVFSRRVVGWSIDSHQATPLVTNALGMAINHRNPLPDQTVIHSDHGSQGGFNWSSQHLVDGGVDGDDARAAAGGAAVSGADPITGPADGGVASGPCPVLGGDRSRREDPGRRGGGARWRRACHPLSRSAGSVTLAA
jgi:hypothetical protein